jgi:hypothetical protein
MLKRRRFKQTETLDERLAKEAEKLKAQLQTMPPGLERDHLVRKARQAETASQMNDWLRSPGLRSPK